jgi:hypothetical protein
MACPGVQLPFCKPAKVVDLPENLGEALAGEKAHTSAFKIRMRKNEYCKTLCRQTYTPAQMEEFQDFAILDYRVNMRLDNLPVAEITKFYYDDKPDQTLQTYNLGVPLGAKLHEEVRPCYPRRVCAPVPAPLRLQHPTAASLLRLLTCAWW